MRRNKRCPLYPQ